MSAWDSSRILCSNPVTAGLITPYNLPKSVNMLINSNKKVLLGAIAIDGLRSKSANSGFSGNLIVFQSPEVGKPVLVGKQRIEFKANVSELQKKFFELSTPIVIEPYCEYRFRFVFDSSWVPRNFYCLTKIIKYDTNIDDATTITVSPEKHNGDAAENELPLILYFNRI